MHPVQARPEATTLVRPEPLPTNDEALKLLALTLPSGAHSGRVRVTLDGRAVQAARTREGNRLQITMAADVIVKAGQILEVRAS